MALKSFNFAYCSWRTNANGDKRNGRTVEDWDGPGREGKGGRGGTVTVTCIKLIRHWLTFNWLKPFLASPALCMLPAWCRSVSTLYEGATGTSALVPNCLRCEVSWVRSVRTLSLPPPSSTVAAAVLVAHRRPRPLPSAAVVIGRCHRPRRTGV